MLTWILVAVIVVLLIVIAVLFLSLRGVGKLLGGFLEAFTRR